MDTRKIRRPKSEFRKKAEGRNPNGWPLERWVLQSLASGVWCPRFSVSVSFEDELEDEEECCKDEVERAGSETGAPIILSPNTLTCLRRGYDKAGAWTPNTQFSVLGIRSSFGFRPSVFGFRQPTLPVKPGTSPPAGTRKRLPLIFSDASRRHRENRRRRGSRPNNRPGSRLPNRPGSRLPNRRGNNRRDSRRRIRMKMTPADNSIRRNTDNSMGDNNRRHNYKFGCRESHRPTRTEHRLSSAGHKSPCCWRWDKPAAVRPVPSAAAGSAWY